MIQQFLRWLLRIVPIVLMTLLIVFVMVWQGWDDTKKISNATLVLGIGILLMLIITIVFWNKYTSELDLAMREEQLREYYLRFLERLDHELKNRITAIGLAATLSESLIEECRDTGYKLCYADDILTANANIRSQNRRLNNLVTNLRKISQIATVELDIESVNLGELLQERIEILKGLPGADTRYISISIDDVPRPLPTIRGDSGLLDTAFKNVLDNALKYTTSGDKIDVKAHKDKGDVIFTVSDTGRGIHPDDLPYIWDDLYRSADTDHIEGSGLGLAMTRGIVERHGGRIAAESWLDEGTRIIIKLPVSQT